MIIYRIKRTWFIILLMIIGTVFGCKKKEDTSNTDNDNVTDTINDDPVAEYGVSRADYIIME